MEQINLHSDHNNEPLNHFVQEIRQSLIENLKHIILFGSRARGDNSSDADYDCLIVVDNITPYIKDTVDEISGNTLYKYNAVFSAFVISEEKYHNQIFNPLLINIRREGISL